MDYQERPPAAELSQIIDAVWTLSDAGPRQHPDLGTILPDGAVEIVFSRASPIAVNPGRRTLRRLLLGPADRVRRVWYGEVVGLVGLRLKPGVAAGLIDGTVAPFANRIVPLAAAAPAFDRALARATARTPSSTACAAAMERTLAEYVARTAGADRVVARAADAIRARRGRLRIDTLAASLGLSRRQLERRFRHAIGLTPKRWARVVRFQCAVDEMSKAPRTWADLAAEIGYADQAHFAREFSAFSSAPPTAAWWTKAHR